MKHLRWLAVSLIPVALACGGKDRSDEIPAPTPVTNAAPAAPAAEESAPTDDDLPGIWVFVRVDGYAFGYGQLRYHLPMCGEQYDTAALAALAGQIRARTKRDDISLSAEAGLRYQQLITAMDAAVQGGMQDVGVVQVSEVPAELTQGGLPSAVAGCGLLADDLQLPPQKETPSDPPVVISNAPDGSGEGEYLLGPGAAAPAPVPVPQPDSSAIVVISTTEISFDGTVVASLDKALVGKLVPALRPPVAAAVNAGRTLAILQADRSVDVAVVLAVMATLSDGGVDQVLFAVNSK